MTDNRAMPTARTRPRRITLRDGREVTLRAIRESDAEEIMQAFDRLSVDSRYARFMHHKPHINEQALAKTVCPTPGRAFVYVATTPADDGIDIVGAAQYLPATDANSYDPPETATCEFAITVADDWRGNGLARQLLTCLVRRARRDGYTTMQGYVLSSNLPMLGLARSLKFTAALDPDGAQVTMVKRSLAVAPRPRTAAPARKPPPAQVA